MLKRLLVVSAVVFFGITAASAPGPRPQEGAQAPAPGVKNTTPKPTAQALARAKQIYSVDCVICHGESGDGKTDLAKDMQLTLADWTDPKALGVKTDADLFKMIRGGKDKMPAEETGRATDDQVRHLIYYIRSLAKDQPATAPAPATEPAPAAPPAPPAS